MNQVTANGRHTDLQRICHGQCLHGIPTNKDIKKMGSEVLMCMRVLPTMRRWLPGGDSNLLKRHQKPLC